MPHVSCHCPKFRRPRTLSSSRDKNVATDFLWRLLESWGSIPGATHYALCSLVLGHGHPALARGRGGAGSQVAWFPVGKVTCAS